MIDRIPTLFFPFPWTEHNSAAAAAKKAEEEAKEKAEKEAAAAKKKMEEGKYCSYIHDLICYLEKSVSSLPPFVDSNM